MTDAEVQLLRSKPWRHHTAPKAGAPWGFLGDGEAHLLYHLARDYWSDAGVLVDAGAFLGCSAWYFAQGLAARRPPAAGPRRLVHCFDNFIVNDALTTNAIAGQFHEILPIGASTRHLFERQTTSVAGWLEIHQGDFHTYAWSPQPVEILLVDIAKAASLNQRVFEVFFPALIPGRSIVVHQDYHHPWLPHIHVSMELLADYFEIVEPQIDDSAAFLLTRAIPGDVLAGAARAHELPFERQLALMDAAIERLPDASRRHVELARANMLGTGRGFEAMRAAMDDITRRYPADDPHDAHWGAYRRDMLRMLGELKIDLAAGWRLVQQGAVADALALAESVPADDSRYPDALVLQAHCLRYQHQLPEAKARIADAIARRADHAPSWIEQAWLELELRQFAAAVESARSGLRCALDPSHVAGAHDVMALAYSMLGQHEAAVTAGEAAVAASPQAWVLLHHAENLDRAGRREEAIRTAERVLAIDPANSHAQAIVSRR